MDQILGIVTKYTEKRHEDDFVDRLNFQYTSYVFAFSALVIGYNTYFGTAISCWTPAEFKKGWVEYTRDYCLIENTYYVPIEDPNMPPQRFREEKEITYYQWVQFILVFLAFLFYIPYLYWSTVNWWSGLQVKAVVDAACKLHKTDAQSRQEQIEKIANHLKKYIDRQNRHTKKNQIPLVPNAISENWVAFNYVLTKALFVLNLIVQMFLIHMFLGFDIYDFFNLRVGFGSNWIANGIFPRQTMCDFEIRKKGSIQDYSVQCVLSMNMLNEKIFLALFYWIIVLFILTFVNLITSFMNFFHISNRKAFVARMLSAGGHEADDETGSGEKESLVDKQNDYSNQYNRIISVSPDIVVILHLIARNAGDNICHCVIDLLFKKISDHSE